VIRVEEANDALWLLEGLDEAIQKDAVKAAVMPTNAILVVFKERVHERPRCLNCSRVLPSWDALYRPAGGWDIKGEALG
jgi:hypothetical protein